MTFFDYSVPVNPTARFGLRDDEKGKEALKLQELARDSVNLLYDRPAKELPAFIDYENEKEWNVVVESDNRQDFNFIAIDNNIPYQDEAGNEKSRCDALIWTPSTIAFVELKDQARDWLDGAIL